MTILAPITTIALIWVMALILTLVSRHREHPACPPDHDPERGYGIPANFDS